MKLLRQILLIGFVATGCPRPAGPPPLKPATTRPVFTVKNECAFDIWIQQQNMPSATPAVVKVSPKMRADYDIPVAGLASTRFWAKTGCDSTGQNCKVGQSSPPCPAAGCTPPVDSKLEATWGCDLDEKSCGKTPQGKTLKGPTFWNSSAVDGYTLPYAVEVAAGSGAGCLPVNCNELMQSQCPDGDNLSTGGKFPKLADVDLHVSGEGDACFSPCMALTAANDGGHGFLPGAAEAQMYCCPTPPISSPACKAGPVVKTKYVEAVHAMCHGTAYAFAYDDGIGGRTCSPTTKITMTYCPPQPAAK